MTTDQLVLGVQLNKTTSGVVLVLGTEAVELSPDTAARLALSLARAVIEGGNEDARALITRERRIPLVKVG